MSQAKTQSVQKDLWGRDENGYRIQPTAEEIVEGIWLGGGELWLDGYELRARLPKRNLKLDQWLAKQEKEIALIAPACSKYPFPHIHNSRSPRRIPAPTAVSPENNRNRRRMLHPRHERRCWSRPDGSSCCAACHPNPEEPWKQIQRTKTNKEQNR